MDAIKTDALDGFEEIHSLTFGFVKALRDFEKIQIRPASALFSYLNKPNERTSWAENEPNMLTALQQSVYELYKVCHRLDPLLKRNLILIADFTREVENNALNNLGQKRRRTYTATCYKLVESLQCDAADVEDEWKRQIVYLWGLEPADVSRLLQAYLCDSITRDDLPNEVLSSIELHQPGLITYNFLPPTVIVASLPNFPKSPDLLAVELARLAGSMVYMAGTVVNHLTAIQRVIQNVIENYLGCYEPQGVLMPDKSDVKDLLIVEELIKMIKLSVLVDEQGNESTKEHTSQEKEVRTVEEPITATNLGESVDEQDSESLNVKVLLAQQSGILTGTFHKLSPENQYGILALLFGRSKGNVKNALTALYGNNNAGKDPLNMPKVIERANSLITEKELRLPLIKNRKDS